MATPSNTAGIPGFENLSNSASSVIQNLLSGLPSAQKTRRRNAYFGAGSGLDSTSPFLENRGFGMFNDEAKQDQQSGIENLLRMIGTYSGTVAPTAGQEMQNNQFNQTFGYRQQQDALARQDRDRLLNEQTREGQASDWIQSIYESMALNPLNSRPGAGGSPSPLNLYQAAHPSVTEPARWRR